jgi:Leucine-rich repeat (LRR) protein
MTEEITTLLEQCKNLEECDIEKIKATIIPIIESKKGKNIRRLPIRGTTVPIRGNGFPIKENRKRRNVDVEVIINDTKYKISETTKIKMTYVDLFKIPREITKLVYLKELTLRYTFIKELTSEIKNLVNLEKLKLEHNKLEFLNDEIGQLTNLTKLSLNDNKLITLPSTISNIPLKKLKLNNNELGYLPESLGSLDKLKTLDLTNNRLTKLPETMNGLISLRILKVAKNPIFEYPPLPDSLELLFMNNNDTNEMARENMII